MRCWVDGMAGAAVPADDRGLQFGDGVFRTCLVWEQGIHAFDDQLTVLQHDADALGLTFDRGKLSTEMQTAARTLGSGVLKIMLTRRQAGRGYRPDWPASTRRILLAGEMPRRPVSAWSRGVDVQIVDAPRIETTALAAHKHMNRLVQVMAQRAIGGSGVDEALLLNEHGRIVGGSMATLFLVTADHVVCTPALAEGALAGCTRGQVLRHLGSLDVEVREQAIASDDLFRAQELFLTNSLIGVWPVKAIRDADSTQEKQWSVPGAVTRRLAGSMSHPLQQRMIADAAEADQ